MKEKSHEYEPKGNDFLFDSENIQGVPQKNWD